MVKVALTLANGKRLIVLGLSEVNVQKLKDDKPIHIHGVELDIEPDIVVTYGQTEEELVKTLKARGLIPPGAKPTEQVTS